MVCCKHCGFVYADTTATQEDYDLFYAKFSKYEDDKTSTGSGDTPWDAKRLEGTARQIAKTLTNKRERILDIGCANGGLLKCLRKLGFDNLCGIDPSPVCVANTQSSGIEAHTGSLLQLPEELGGFDFVILSHVLEHVHDLKTAMQTISNALTRERERERSVAFMLKFLMRHDMWTIFFHRFRTSILSTSIISRTSVSGI